MGYGINQLEIVRVMPHEYNHLIHFVPLEIDQWNSLKYNKQMDKYFDLYKWYSEAESNVYLIEDREYLYITVCPVYNATYDMVDKNRLKSSIHLAFAHQKKLNLPYGKFSHERNFRMFFTESILELQHHITDDFLEIPDNYELPKIIILSDQYP